jgi:hypothetical protein
MRWRAFYADGRRYSSADGPWVDLPAYGLVVAVWWEANGQRHLECGDDALVLASDAIVGVNLPTPRFERAAYEEQQRGALKRGVYMDPESWAVVRQEAEDARTPPED